MFEDQPFSIPVDWIDCRIDGDFRLSAPMEVMRQAMWRSAIAARPSAFDGALLRLERHHVADGRLRLGVSRTSFSAYVATRDPDFTDHHPGHERADSLGMTAIVLTADRYAIVTRRSLSADQNPGALYFVGGYAEPPERGDAVDLFGEIAREVVEEVAVTDLIRQASFAIGMAYDPVYCHPEISFLTISRSTARDILDRASRAPDRAEAASVVAMPLAELLADGCATTDTPQTWSYLKTRAFLARHLIAYPL